jgi:3-(3-hydroxy-phenyl)propionate hydroxylase
LTAVFGAGFVALYFGLGSLPPAWLTRASQVPRTGVAALRLVRMTPDGEPDARTLIDQLGQAWQRYDAVDGTLYLIRPDGYVMGRWRDAASAGADFHRALARALKEST